MNEAKTKATTNIFRCPMDLDDTDRISNGDPIYYYSYASSGTTARAMSLMPTAMSRSSPGSNAPTARTCSPGCRLAHFRLVIWRGCSKLTAP